MVKNAAEFHRSPHLNTITDADVYRLNDMKHSQYLKRTFFAALKK